MVSASLLIAYLGTLTIMTARYPLQPYLPEVYSALDSSVAVATDPSTINDGASPWNLLGPIPRGENIMSSVLCSVSALVFAT